MSTERWSVVCPDEPHRQVVRNEHPGPVCPVCKKVFGFGFNECPTRVKVLNSPTATNPEQERGQTPSRKRGGARQRRK